MPERAEVDGEARREPLPPSSFVNLRVATPARAPHKSQLVKIGQGVADARDFKVGLTAPPRPFLRRPGDSF